MPFVRALALAALLVAPPPAAAAADCGCHTLADPSVQARTGWRTDWTVQLPFDSSRFAVTHAVVEGDLVIVQTSDGGVHAIDSGDGPARGTVRWSRRVGSPDGLMHPASVGPTLVVAAGDRDVHGLRKTDGSTGFTQRMPTMVTASAIETGGSVYIPTAAGTIERSPADRFADPSPNLAISADGSLDTAPFPIGEDAIAWVTTDGTLVALQPYAEGWGRTAIKLPSPAAGRPLVNGDDVFVATTVGDLLRLRVRRTQSLGLELVWRMPLRGRPDGGLILDGETLFVSLGIDGVVAIATDTGGIRWHADSPALRFRDRMGIVAAGGGRLWCIDAVGRLSMLDAATGERIGCAPLDGFTVPVVSRVPGRLVLARPDGRITSLKN